MDNPKRVIWSPISQDFGRRTQTSQKQGFSRAGYFNEVGVRMGVLTLKGAELLFRWPEIGDWSSKEKDQKSSYQRQPEKKNTIYQTGK